MTVRWIDSVRKGISTEIGGYQKVALASIRRRQSGVALTLLWSLVVNNLITKLNDKGFKAQADVNDLVITDKGKFQKIISPLIQQPRKITVKSRRITSEPSENSNCTIFPKD